MQKISISFTKYTDVLLLNKAELIYASLNGNPDFSTLGTLLTAVKAGIDKYAVDLAAAANRDRVKVAVKNQSRSDLQLLLNGLGFAVMAEAKGDEPKLVESGYTLYKTPESRYITNPGNVTLSAGVSTGEMVSVVKAVAGAKSYVHQITTSLNGEATTWESSTSSASRYTFDNLVPGTQYWVRVAVIGGRNQVAYSNVATWFAQ